MGTMEQDMSNDYGVEWTARDVLSDEELEQYARQGGKPSDVASGPGEDPWDTPGTIDPYGLAGSA